jgi:hypothetical protein
MVIARSSSSKGTVFNLRSGLIYTTKNVREIESSFLELLITVKIIEFGHTLRTVRAQFVISFLKRGLVYARTKLILDLKYYLLAKFSVWIMLASRSGVRG